MCKESSPRTPPSEGLDGDVVAILAKLLRDAMFALYLETKNFHSHVSGAHFRECHLLLDAQADQVLTASLARSSPAYITFFRHPSRQVPAP
jgi:hypothetical protein